MKILIVDDSPSMRLVVRDVVGDLECELRECLDGFEAVLTYRAWRPDWVVMDVRMPGIDGFTATRLIRAEFPEARIVITSIHADPDVYQAAADAGAQTFLPKNRLTELPGILQPQSAKESP